MKKDFGLFIKKAEKIIADAPPHAREKDKIAMLNQRFRLGKKEARMLLRELR